MRYQHQGNKIEVAVADAHIHNATNEEGEDELQQHAQKQPYTKLDDQVGIIAEILGNVANTALVLFFTITRIKLGSGLHQQNNTMRFSFIGLNYPMTQKLLLIQLVTAFSGVGNPNAVFVYAVYHHKVFVFPMHYTGHRNNGRQLLKRGFYRQGLHANGFRCITNAQQSYPLTPYVTQLAQVLQRIKPTVVACDHP